MTAGGVIPAPEDRTPAALFLGHVTDIDGLRLYIGPHRDRVCIEGSGVHLCFAKAEREQFMRLWCEAERQAETAGLPERTPGHSPLCTCALCEATMPP